MTEMELYHVHIFNKENRKWKENKKIIIPSDFESGMYRRHISFTQSAIMPTFEGLEQIMYTSIIQNAYQQIVNIHNPRELSREQLEGLKEILENSYLYLSEANMFKRESALEKYRQDYCQDLPSRLHSIYLCDEAGLSFWEKTLAPLSRDGDISVFKVRAKGNIFQTNEQLLPFETNDFETAYKEAFHYWNPGEKAKLYPEQNEHLVQGEIQILKRMK